MPILGAWVADEFLGRLKTIQYSIAFAMVGHVILIISAIPPVIVHPNGAIACFAIGLVIFGIGVGGFKCVPTPPLCFWAETDSVDRSNIAPLIAEQYKETKLFIKTIPKTGERVIVDPSQTITRIFLYFYFIDQRRGPYRLYRHGLRGEIRRLLALVSSPYHYVLLLSNSPVPVPQ